MEPSAREKGSMARAEIDVAKLNATLKADHAMVIDGGWCAE